MTSLALGLLAVGAALVSGFLIEAVPAPSDAYGMYLAGGIIALGGLALAAAAVVTGLIALRRVRDGWEYGRSVAGAGLGTGFVAIVPCLALTAYNFFVYSVRITF